MSNSDRNRCRLPRSVLAHAAALAVLAGGFSLSATAAPRQMENLDRGVVAIAKDDGSVFVSWRLLGTEPDDLGFNVYRTVGNGQPTKLNDKPLTGPTHFVDQKVERNGPVSYSVRAVGSDGKEQADGRAFTLAAGAAKPYLEVPLKTPKGYAANDTSAADLDGDGQYELIVHMTGRGKDNSQAGETDPPILQAYKLDGTLLWEINLGHNIREGAHYTQFQVMDYDGDGHAEMIVKTADGTTDAKGKVIGDANARHANDRGYVLKGPEFLTLFDGRTGAALDTVKYAPGRLLTDDAENPSADAMKALWGDGYGNRGDRFLAGSAYLDGVRPSAIMCRGYYTRSFLSAWDVKEGKLVQRWFFDSEDPKVTGDAAKPTASERSGRNPYSGQGYHSLSIADVDGDGKDEVVYGSMTVDDDGRGLYTTGWGHGDAQHVGDLDPDNPGLEIFGIQERFDDAGAHMHDAKTGKPLWKKPSAKAATEGGDRGEGPGRGVAFDVDPRTPGAESWTAGAGIEGIWDAKGNEIGKTKPASCNFRIYWDGDLLDELLDRNHISKWNWEKQTTDRLLTADGCESINGTKANPCLSADLLGDWREEVVFRTSDNQALRIYSTTIPTEYRRFTLMHDPQYRVAIAWQNTAYNQPPHVSVNMQDLAKGPLPKPSIQLVQPKGQAAAR